jgi:alkanesulfonate monooxygenase SsuD/methylene tetrahydromethanopterin reductase-like flavin-dependent oxidoreductase (luciferase family)
MWDRPVLSLFEIAEHAEASGFDSLWCGDSVFVRGRFDPITLLAGVAAQTRRILIGTAVLLAPLRHPLFVAHGLASLDRLSEGRLIAGIGNGWIPQEFEAAGRPFAGRLRRSIDTLHECRQAWSGSHDMIQPVRAGGPPFWMGGAGPRTLAAAGTHFDGWMPTVPTAEAYRTGLAAVRRAAGEAGRDDGAITPAMYVTVNLDGNRGDVDEYVRAYYDLPLGVLSKFQAYFTGDADACAEWLRGYVDAGARHFVLRFATRHPLAHIDAAAERVLPLVRA